MKKSSSAPLYRLSPSPRKKAKILNYSNYLPRSILTLFNYGYCEFSDSVVAVRIEYLSHYHSFSVPVKIPMIELN